MKEHIKYHKIKYHHNIDNIKLGAVILTAKCKSQHSKKYIIQQEIQPNHSVIP